MPDGFTIEMPVGSSEHEAQAVMHAVHEQRMRIAKVIGNVTLSRWHPAMGGACYRVATPLDLSQLKAHVAGEAARESEPIVVYDELGAGDGSLIAVSEGGEAAQPFRPKDKPIDAYNAAILDRIEL